MPHGEGGRKIAVSEGLNRCPEVTDKRGHAWQKAGKSMPKSALKSVCRELPPWRWLHQGRVCIVCV